MLEWWKQIVSWIPSSHAWMVSFLVFSSMSIFLTSELQKYGVPNFLRLSKYILIACVNLSACGMILCLACFLLALSDCSFTAVPIFKLLGKLPNLDSWKMVICSTHQLACHECEDNTPCPPLSHYNYFLLDFEFLTLVSYRLLSSPTCPVLEVLGKKLSFEIAVGLNGRVWVCSSNCPFIIIFYPTFLLFVRASLATLFSHGISNFPRENELIFLGKWSSQTSHKW
jgi:hypothetical protein